MKPWESQDTVGNSRETVANSRETVGKQSEAVGKQSETVGKQSETVGKQSENSRKQLGNSRKQSGNSRKQSETVGKRLGNSRSRATVEDNRVKESKETIGHPSHMLKQAVDRSWPTNSSVWLIIQDSPKNLSNFTVTQLKQLGVYFYAAKKVLFSIFLA